MRRMTALTRHDIAVKLHVTASPQHCQHLAYEVGKHCCGKSPYLACTEARSKAAARIWNWITDRGGAGLAQMTGLTVNGQSSQHRMGEDTPSDLQQPIRFKDRKVDGLQLYGLGQAAPDPLGPLPWLTLDQCPPLCGGAAAGGGGSGGEEEEVGGMLALALLMAVAAKSSSLVTPCPCWHSPRVEIQLLFLL